MYALHDLLLHAARSAPTKQAVIFEGRVLTYAELAHRTRCFARLLVEGDVEPGDRVAFWATNRSEFVEFLFGTSLAGAIAVPIDHWATPEGAVRILERMRPRAVVAARDQVEGLDPFRDRIEAAGVEVFIALDHDAPARWTHYDSAVAQADPLPVGRRRALDDAALVLFTSGSTGTPKGAVHTHRDLANSSMIMAVELGLREHERTLHFLPLFSSCLEQLLPLTLVRGAHVIMSRFDAEAVWELVDRYGVTHLDAVPTMLNRLLVTAPVRPPESLRMVSYASEPMPADLIAALTDFAPAVEWIEFYGMIEQLCLTVLKPWEQLRGPGVVGRPMVGAALRVVDESGEELAIGESGEILATSPTLMAGYWDDDEATRSVVSADGWMRTGDLGSVDEHGYLTLHGRLKEVIKSGGMTVVPREVEAALREHASVHEAAVVGVPSERWGEEVHAFVVSASASVTSEDLVAHCKQLLPTYKVPKHVHLLEALPRTGIGKIARKALVEEVSGRESGTRRESQSAASSP